MIIMISLFECHSVQTFLLILTPRL